MNITQYIITNEKSKQINDIVGYAGLMPCIYTFNSNYIYN